MRTIDTIVQVEFVHIGKTVLRFEDIGGTLTLHALESSLQLRQLRAWRKTILRMKPGWRSQLNEWRYRRSMRSYEQHKEHLTTLCANAAIMAFMCGRTVAVQYLDHRFRVTRHDEHTELIERVRRAERAWVFISKPNELCSDQLQGIATVM